MDFEFSEQLHLPYQRFSKKIENHVHAVALHFMSYNFARTHQSLGTRVTPAIAAGLAQHPWSLTQIAELLD